MTAVGVREAIQIAELAADAFLIPVGRKRAFVILLLVCDIALIIEAYADTHKVAAAASYHLLSAVQLDRSIETSKFKLNQPLCAEYALERLLVCELATDRFRSLERL